MKTRNLSATARVVSASALTLSILACSTMSAAPDEPRAYAASSDVYKVIADKGKYVIMMATWKPGQRDQPHSHPDLGGYVVNDCALRIHEADGKWRDAKPKAGLAFMQAPVKSHWVENIGGSDCRIVIFETK